MKISFRRVGVVLAALVCTLGIVGVVLAAEPDNVNFTISPTMTPLVGQEITVTSTATDEDGDILTTEWDFDYDGSFQADITDLATDDSATHAYTTPGEKDIAVRVTDGVVGDGESISIIAERTVTVVAPNVGPTASFTVSPNPAAAGQVVTFDGSGSSDPDGTIASLDHDWDLDGDGEYDDASGTVVQRSYASGGARVIGLRVTDSDDASDTAPTQTLVVGNAAPNASFTIEPNPAGVGQTVTFDGSASSDPEGPITSANHDWDLNGDGVLESTGTVVTRSYPAGASIPITLQVTDSNGVTDTTTQTLTISGGAPTASFTVSPNPARIGEAVTLNGSASSDPEGPIASADHDWDLDGDGQYDDASGTIVTTDYLEPGPKTIGLRVTDSDDVEAFTTRTLTVNNTAPTASFTISPAAPRQVNQTITFNGSASNDDGDPGGSITAYRWDLDGDDEFDDDTGEVATLAYPNPGTYEIRLQVVDNNGAVATSNTQVLRINAPPNPSFTISPNPAILNETIALNASSSNDFDGSIAAYEWDFDYNGTTFTVDATGVTASTSYATPGDRTIRLRVRDNSTATSELSREVVVQRTRPNASFTFTPQAPVPGQAIGFSSQSTPSASPGNPSIISTEWDFNYDPTKDFSPDASGPNASTAYPTPGPKTVAIRVTESGGGFAVTSLTVNVNAPPTASFNVAPASPFDGDSVTFSSTSGDPDGPLTGVQWDLDADGQYDDASGPVVSRAYAAGARTVRLLVTDSRGATATAERRFDVLRRPPRLLGGVKISLFGNLTDKGARLKRLLVRTPAKATAKVTCAGRKCPKGTKKVSTRPVKTRRLRFKKFERVFPAGSLITVSVTRPGFIGQHTTIKIRGNLRRYIRRDRCLPAGGGKPIACPDS